jgi:hypothetical protein
MPGCLPSSREIACALGKPRSECTPFAFEATPHVERAPSETYAPTSSIMPPPIFSLETTENARFSSGFFVGPKILRSLQSGGNSRSNPSYRQTSRARRSLTCLCPADVTIVDHQLGLILPSWPIASAPPRGGSAERLVAVGRHSYSRRRRPQWIPLRRANRALRLGSPLSTHGPLLRFHRTECGPAVRMERDQPPFPQLSPTLATCRSPLPT